MSVLGKSMKNLLLRNWTIPYQNVRNGFACFSSKVTVPVPPKRPLTAYMIFCKENRKDLLKEYPDLSSAQQIKKLAEKWSQLTDESKKPFEIMAREETVAYGEEHRKFFENLSEEQKLELARRKADKKLSRQLLKLKKALKESGLPKAPAVSSYAYFVQTLAKAGGITQPMEFIKEAAVQWKNLPEEKKKFYEEKAQEEKRRYLLEMEEWKNKMMKEGKLNLLEEYNRLKGQSELSEDDSTDEPKVKRKMKRREESN